MKNGRAFSLVELLVVISIIALLAALLLPALGRAKDKARAVYCLNNLRQWGVATHAYILDHDDFLPNEGFGSPTTAPQFTNGWYYHLPVSISLPPYVTMTWRTNTGADPGRSIWICPSNPRRSNGKNLFHYCLNEEYDDTADSDHSVKYSTLKQPSNLVWMFDSMKLPAVGPANFVHTNLHSQGAQFLFLDGHSRHFKSRFYWDVTTNHPITNNPNIVWTQ
jgi:prepilin-type N-terminal cleavage/methylation domain-containing protein/prepilin-type processing-associated H-X9-DG protein